MKAQHRSHLLKIEGLTKFYGDFAALKDVSFEVKQGSTTLLIGPNGAGKTTIIKCIMGLLNFRGRILLEERDARRDGPAIRNMIGYVPQASAYYENLSVLGQSRLIGKLKNAVEEKTREKLRMMNLWEVRGRPVRSLSSGMKQRLGIALALLTDPPFLIFDEPTSNIDVRGQLEFQALLQEFSRQGKTILITTHLTGLGKYAEKVVVLDSGRIVAAGSPEQLLAALGAADTVRIKLPSSELSGASEILKRNGAADVSVEGGWLLFSARSAEKSKLITTIIESGISIEDMVIQPRDVESEYLKLIGAGQS